MGSTSAFAFKGIVCERCGVEVTSDKVRRERMGHIALSAPVVHIWYLRGTRSWLAYLLMGTAPKEELKAKQLEKVIYFAAHMVTYVDEARRHDDLAELRVGLNDEILEIAEREVKALDNKLKEIEARAAKLEADGAKESELRALQRGTEKELDGVRSRFAKSANWPSRPLTRSRVCTHVRSSKTKCCIARWSFATVTTSKAAWEPTPSFS